MVRYLDYNPFSVFDNNLLSDVIHLTDEAKKMLKSMLVLFDEPTVHVLDYHLLAKHDIKLSDPLRYKAEYFDDGSFADWLPTYSIEVRTGSLDQMVLSVGFMYDELEFMHLDSLGKCHGSDTISDELKASLAQIYHEAGKIHSYLKGN